MLNLTTTRKQPSSLLWRLAAPARQAVPQRPAATAPLKADAVQLEARVRRSTLELDIREAYERLPEASMKKLALETMVEAPRSAAEARRAAEALWFGEGRAETMSKDADGDGHKDTRNVIVDAQDVNDNANAFTARLHVEANQALVDGYLKAHPEAAAAYGEVQALLKDDPHAQLAMQLLLLEGKLTSEPLSADGKDLAATLQGMLEAELAPGVDRAELVGSLVREIATPSAINQKSNPTCAATSTQILMAQEAPAEYARLIAGLASPEGAVKLANGDTVKRLDGAIAGQQAEGKTDTRSLTARLWQPTMMDYANGELGYDYATSKHSDDEEKPSGLTSSEFDRLYDGLLNQDTQRLHESDSLSRSDIWDQVEAAVAAGQSVPVGMDWNAGGHKVVVTDVRDGYVYYTNPWGTEERMTVEAFEARIYNAHLVEEPIDFAA